VCVCVVVCVCECVCVCVVRMWELLEKSQWLYCSSRVVRKAMRVCERERERERERESVCVCERVCVRA